MALLEVENLNVSIPTAAGMLHAVRGVDFQLRRGRTLSLVGESGCGKSLTVMAVMNLLPPGAQRRVARLFFDGEDIAGATERRMADIRGHRMAMIFQEPMTSLNPCYTIGNQLMEALQRHRKVSRKQARDRAMFLLEKVGITAAVSRLGQYPHQLSGGLRQRVMIAMALMCSPAVIIADEPTTALDVTIQAQILSLLVSLQQEFQTGMILITHDLGIVSRVADDVCVMYCGQIVERASTEVIFESPLHPYTQGLLACIPIPGKTRPGQYLGSIPGMVPSPIGDLTGCIFRNRCPHATAECAQREISLRSGPEMDGHTYRCLLSPEICRSHGNGEKRA
ncbi:MAG: ABC transporter ATP-binding protein [Desulfobacterales bacterium]|jgi:peptide/nickel transport system ATP-binding protein